MKRKIALITGLIFFIIHTASVIAAVKVQEPEYIGTYFLIQSKTGKLIPLERIAGEGKFKAKAFGLGGGETVLEYEGEKSPVRFRDGVKMKFVLRVASQQNDPQELIQFYVLEPKKGKRRLTIVKASTIGMNSRSVTSEHAIAYHALKYGKSSFVFSAVKNLKPGEYMLGVPTSNDGFCFGVDPADTKKE